MNKKQGVIATCCLLIFLLALIVFCQVADKTEKSSEKDDMGKVEHTMERENDTEQEESKNDVKENLESSNPEQVKSDNSTDKVQTPNNEVKDSGNKTQTSDDKAEDSNDKTQTSDKGDMDEESTEKRGGNPIELPFVPYRK